MAEKPIYEIRQWVVWEVNINTCLKKNKTKRDESAKNFAGIYFKCIYKYLLAEWTGKDSIIYEGLRIKYFSLQSPLEHRKVNKWSCDYEIQCS